VKKQYALSILAGFSLIGCTAAPPKNEVPYAGVVEYRVGDIPFEYPESLLTGEDSAACLRWSDSNILATDKVFVFNAAGLSPVEMESLTRRIDWEVDKLSTSMDWASFRWLDSLPVVNRPNGAALLADSIIALDRRVGTAKIYKPVEWKALKPEPGSFPVTEKQTETVDVLNHILPGFAYKIGGDLVSQQAYKHFLQLPRSERVNVVRRYNRLAPNDVGSDSFEILPGRILVCVASGSTPGAVAEGHPMGINIKLGASDQAIRSALIRAYQSARTRAYGQLDQLVPEWFLVGQREFHGGGRIASIEEGMFSSPIYSRAGKIADKPENYPALSALAYRYLGEANEMSLISSLLDAVRYRDMPNMGFSGRHPERFFNDAFDSRLRALDGGALSIRGFDYGWNGLISLLPQLDSNLK
jgi:hypothetical protein